MAEKPKVYPISTLNDLFNVPPDRRAICVQEMLEGIATAERLTEQARRKVEAMPVPRWLEWLRRRALRKMRPQFTRFQWVDDGQFTADIGMKFGPHTLNTHTDDWRRSPIG